MNLPAPGVSEDHLDQLVLEAQRRAPLDVAQILLDESDETVGAVLRHLHPAPAYRILMRFPKDRRHNICLLYTSDAADDSKRV